MNSSIHNVDNKLTDEMWSLLKDLYQIPRTIMGEDYEKSLKIIRKLK